MNKFISKIKYHAENSESEETIVLCIEADTYGTAENASHAWCEENLEGLWNLESIVKSQIKEVYEVENESTFFLVKYEFGLEAKPNKSNLVVSDFHSCMGALLKATEHLEQFVSGLFITSIVKQEIKYFIGHNEVKTLLGIEPEFEEMEDLMEL